MSHPFTGKLGFLWDEFGELAWDHAAARIGAADWTQLPDTPIPSAEDRRYAAVILIANQPFFDPFYGSRP